MVEHEKKCPAYQETVSKNKCLICSAKYTAKIDECYIEQQDRHR